MLKKLLSDKISNIGQFLNNTFTLLLFAAAPAAAVFGIVIVSLTCVHA